MINIETLWAKKYRPLKISEMAKLQDLPLDSIHEFIWLLENYTKDTFYGQVDDFCDYVKAQLAAGDVPDPWSCAAYNNGNGQLVALATELETLLGAWNPDEELACRVEEIRETLKAALT